MLGFTPYWDYQLTTAIHPNNPGVYISDKISNLNTIDKINLKGNVVNGSIRDGLRLPLLFSFVLDKPAGYKVFWEPETIHYKKVNKSVLNTISFYLEDDSNEEVNFNAETLTFTLQMNKI